MNEQTIQIEQIVRKVKERELTPEEGLGLIRGLGKTHIYEKEWVKYIFQRTGQPRQMTEPILFLASDESLYSVMKRQLEGAAAPFIYVSPGDRFEAGRNGCFKMNFTQKEDYEALCRALVSQNIKPRHIVHFLSVGAFRDTDKTMREQLDKSLYSVFYLLQAIMENKLCPKAEVLYLYENVQGEAQPIYRAVESFLKTVQAENPNFRCKTAELKSMSNEPFTKELIADVIFCEWSNQCVSSSFTCYDPRHYYIQQVKKVNKGGSPENNFNIKENGVYLITGGAGGLGFLFAEYLAKRAKVNLILTGRSPSSMEIEQKINTLKKLGSEAVYIPADISKEKETDILIDQIRRTFGRLNGILHSAGLVDDAFVIKKRRDRIEKVIAPKVFGTVWLDKAAKGESLDFFVMFSSLSSILPNAGQSDYAFANGCMDSYTDYRIMKNRPGKTLSINWPLWSAGNMSVGPRELQVLRETGLDLLSAESGLASFQNCMSSNASQLAVINGSEEKIFQLLSVDNTETDVTSESDHELPQISENQLKKQTVCLLKEIIGAETGRPTDSILSGDTFDRYGIDSLTILGLTSRLEKHFGSVSKTLFFEYSSIDQLAEYFLEHHYDKLVKAFSPQSEQRRNITAEKKQLKQRGRCKSSAVTEEDIAIIGIAGRYPMAENVEKFWDNIASGKDCITEIPSERWDHRRYFNTGEKARHKSKWGGFIKDADKFDPLFFSISPHDAELIDPQERLFLETAWHTFENAGYTRGKLKRYKTGVFVGVTYSHYQLFTAGASDDDRKALLSSYSSIANRVSYFFDLHGPSLAIDTMCSSSLSAVHFACESIKRGESSLAIAGGVNLSLHPDKYTLLSQNHFVSSDGRCRSFGAGGDGYVPGEGVGAILLKSLSKAVAEGDTIYGVIKSTSVNHGGKTNGYTVPNPNEQANIISETLDKAGIGADSISYIEAHGTGTSLGDPIEISGLSKAFSNPKSSFRCAIGSVKSNIGHLEAAAGIASITKVLMQMKYKQLAPSIHSHELNPNIDFDETPFYVQTELKNWEVPESHVRRSGISSFGAGGSNAHIIIEEYIDEINTNPAKSEEMQIILLSAKNEERLRILIDSLINELDSNTSLTDVAYTLQTGREAMEERLAVEARDVGELVDKLTKYLQSDQEVHGLYRGNARISSDNHKTLLASSQFQNLYDIALHWVNGGEIDWEDKYRTESPKIISLPAYPFERNRYWVPSSKITQTNRLTRVQSGLHPLLDQNVSTLKMQKFITDFSEASFAWPALCINQQKNLPFSSLIEMAAAGGAMSAEQNVWRMKNICLHALLELTEQPVRTELRLFDQQGAVSFELSERSEREAEQIILNGELEYKEANRETGARFKCAADYKANCEESMTGSECYDLLETNLINYDADLRVLTDLFLHNDFLLADVAIPEKDLYTECIVNPAAVEGAIQAAAVLAARHTGDQGFYLQEIEEICFYQSVPNECYVFVDLNKSNVEERQFTVYLLSHEGECMAVFRNMFFSGWETVVDKPDNIPFDLLCKSWEESQVSSSFLSKGQIIILANIENEQFASELFASDPLMGCTVICRKADSQLHLSGEGFSFDNSLRAKETALAILKENTDITGIVDLSDLWREPVKAAADSVGKLTLLQEIIKAQKHLFVLHITEGLQTFKNKQPTLAGAETAGLIKMLSAEYKKIKAKTIDIDQHSKSLDELQQLIKNEAAADDLYSEICYRNGARYTQCVKKLHPSEFSREIRLPVCQPDQTLVITGGTRGIGAELARHYSDKGVKKFVLMGLTELPQSDERDDLLKQTDKKSTLYSKLKLLKELEQKGVQIEIYGGSLTEKEKLQQFFSKVRKKHGQIGGVIHCAGVANHVNPAFIHKTSQEIKEVFEPKIQGLQVLHDIFLEDNLKFFILFSSVASAFPLLGAGTSEYAAANSFMDYFAAYQHACGRTYYKSINWPSWKEIGMGEVKSPAYQALGLLSHRTETGIGMLDQIMKVTGYPCLIPVKTNHEKFSLQQLPLTKIQTSVHEPSVVNEQLSDDTDNEAIISILKDIFSTELKIPCEKLDQDTSFSEYGVDSILLVQLVKKAEAAFQIKIEPSAFLEYPNFKQLAYYLNQLFEDEDVSIQHISDALGNEREVKLEDRSLKSNGLLGFKTRMNKKTFPKQNEFQEKQKKSNQIAIIGIGCDFPDAENKELFWQNLEKGKDSVREVPTSRWDISQYYSDTYKKGKSISKWGGFLEDIEHFDPVFFNMSESEASQLDPLIKKCLEVSVQTLRDGGYRKEEVSNKEVGVFIGSRAGTFMSRISSPSKNTIVGIGQNFIGAHISHFLNLKGPNLVVDTACSSSLVSVHLACQSLISKESDMAIAGGVDILLDQKPYLMLSEARALSPEGKCRTFDEKADGFVPGEGCGTVLLKRLDEALTDGDQIYAVIDGSAVNNDGQTMGMTTPNPKAQSAVIKKALKNGGIDASSLSYVETHGTGTMIGDPIELKALTEVFREVTEEKQFCGVGSVKTNFGHLMSAAGIASVIKVALSIWSQKLPPTLHCQTPNPRFKFDQSPFFPNTALKDWNPRKGVLRAGISSFGFGGTNAHMLLSNMHFIMGYTEPKRQSLPPAVFNKKRCWIDKRHSHKEEEADMLIPLLEFKEL
ncbi:Polyketide synthase PksN [Bacillus subtilis]|nr:Polyketide synthase PksN [Bacillus cereus]CUB36509.1 Polyketide synthase PksN [Bacillus subtilis]